VPGLYLCLADSNEEMEEMPECRDGDVRCYTQTGHRLFTEGQHAEAVTWFTKGGDLPNALDGLGFAYETGQGTPKDINKAVQLYTKAASADYDQAMFHLANCYSKGIGVQRDRKIAAQWFRKAADQGHASAAYNLGLQLYHGDGVEENKADAFAMFKKAADVGHTDAAYNVGVYYLSTRGPARDTDADEKAMEWFERAASKGSTDAMVNLAMMYNLGRGTNRDDKRSKRLLREAAKLGHEQAKEMLGNDIEEDPDEDMHDEF